MIRFFRRIVLLFRTLWRGLRADPDSAAIGFLLFSLLTVGMCFYHWVEGWGWVDALYFCVMTVATVGFGDFVPTTTGSKVFTIAFTFLGIGLFASFVGKVASIWMRHLRNESRSPGRRANHPGKHAQHPTSASCSSASRFRRCRTDQRPSPLRSSAWS